MGPSLSHSIKVAIDTDLTQRQSMMKSPKLSAFGKILARKWFLGFLEFNDDLIERKQAVRNKKKNKISVQKVGPIREMSSKHRTKDIKGSSTKMNASSARIGSVADGNNFRKKYFSTCLKSNR